MILVTLGTHPQPMDRVLVELERLLEVGAIRGEVLVQAAAFRYQPLRARVETVVPFETLCAQIRAAEVVVSHAGPATLAAIRTIGRVPVVVPRDPAFGEHVDEHQLLYARHLAAQPGYIVVEDVARLADAIERARGARASPRRPDVAAAIAALDREAALIRAAQRR